jgi:predicted 3-demethylubiquinone-9 3-methyltransferase (glyoxalase superfamily)
MITTCLWFQNEAEEAAQYYTSLFSDGKILSVSRFGNEGQEMQGQPEGAVIAVKFIIHGQEMCTLNGNPAPYFHESISLQVHLDTQEEIDHLWNAITSEGSESMCGWCRDKFGVAWQIIPRNLEELMADPGTRSHAMKALYGMKKIIIKELTIQ